MSGLTVGCFSIEDHELKAHVEAHPSSSSRIDTLRRTLTHQNLLLVTLILVNTVANMSMPLFLDPIASPLATLLLTIFLVLTFGEVLPQSLCIGPRKARSPPVQPPGAPRVRNHHARAWLALHVAHPRRTQVTIIAFFTPAIRALMLVCFPVARPLAFVLDRLVGTSSDESSAGGAATEGEPSPARVVRAHTTAGVKGIRGRPATHEAGADEPAAADPDADPASEEPPTATSPRAAAEPDSLGMLPYGTAGWAKTLDKEIRRHMSLSPGEHYRLQLVPAEISAEIPEVDEVAVVEDAGAGSRPGGSRARALRACSCEHMGAPLVVNAAADESPAGNDGGARRPGQYSSYDMRSVTATEYT